MVKVYAMVPGLNLTIRGLNCIQPRQENDDQSLVFPLLICQSFIKNQLRLLLRHGLSSTLKPVNAKVIIGRMSSLIKIKNWAVNKARLSY